MPLTLKNVQVRYESFFVPRPPPVAPGEKEKDPRYEGTFLLGPDHPQVEALLEAAAQAKFDKFKDRDEDVDYELLRYPDKKKIAKGGFVKDEPYIIARNNSAPNVFDLMKQPMTDKGDLIYPGCFVDVALEFYAYDNRSTGVNADLKGIRWRAHGEPFSGGPPASADAFEDLDPDDYDDPLG